MFGTLVEKELKTIILGPKFVVTFTVCSILILLSVFLGIQDYKAVVKSYEAGTQLADQELQEANSWARMGTQIFRKPDPMQIFVSGVNNDIGRFSNIQSGQSIKLTNSVYSDDPIFAVFRFIDFSFIVQIVLSLFAILFTYDAINGERENGTLKLSFSNAIPRFTFIFSKFTGSLLGLIVPLFIPILLSLLMIMLFKIPFTESHWVRLISFIGVSLLYFTFFIALGILVSALTKNSSVSFLLLLVTWVTLVLIIPKISVMTAGKIIPVPTVAEIDGQVEAYSKECWDKHLESLVNVSEKRNTEMEGMTPEEREAHKDNNMWDWMQESDNSRKKIQTDINDFSRRVREDLRNRKSEQERLAFFLSRFSPVSAYQLSAMNLSGTDLKLKTRYEMAFDQYLNTFIDYTEKKLEKSGNTSGIQITFSSDSGMKMKMGNDDGSLDLSDMPKFQNLKRSFNDIFRTTILDIGLLLLYSITTISLAFVAFLRYDVR